MIKRRTVFIVGAGGSIPYRYPSGPSMLRDARTRTSVGLREITNVGPLDTAERFKSALRDCESDSLDSLLELRSDLDEIGRRYIAHEILTAEGQNYDFRPEKGDWLSYLFNHMDTRHSLDCFLDSPVTFITYNYDRRIEYQISRGLHARYIEAIKDVDDRVVEHWRKKPVIHLHGSVGSLIDGAGFVPFGAREQGRENEAKHLVRNWAVTAAKSISIVHQAKSDSLEFQAARNALRNAETVIFLGFSFGRTNVDRLGLDNIRPNTTVLCSCYGMFDSELRFLIAQPFQKIRTVGPTKVGEPNQDCEDVLRSWIELIADRY